MSAQRSEQSAECQDILAQHAKSFALATKFLAREGRERAAAVYAYCRRVDDAIDCVPPAQQGAALRKLADELDAIFDGAELTRPEHCAFRAVVAACAVPQRYPRELLAGMAMDVNNVRYDTLTELLLYCHRVAGVVGLMMCHAFGVTADHALRQAAQLGIAMQLTNICRDVAEDFARRRLYLPRTLLLAEGAPAHLWQVGGPLPDDAASRAALKSVIEHLLRVAEGFYRAGERGIEALPFRAGLAVRVARHLYAAIGRELLAQGCDPTRGRATVKRSKKLGLVALAMAQHVLGVPRYLLSRWRAGGGSRLPRTELAFSADLVANVSHRAVLRA